MTQAYIIFTPQESSNSFRLFGTYKFFQNWLRVFGGGFKTFIYKPRMVTSLGVLSKNTDLGITQNQNFIFFASIRP